MNPNEINSIGHRSVSSKCLKQPTLTGRGCDSTRVTCTVVKSMQKLSMKTSKQTIEDGGNNQLYDQSTHPPAKLNDRSSTRWLHRPNQSEFQCVSIFVDSEIRRSKHSKSHDVAATKSMRRRHCRNHSAST